MRSRFLPVFVLMASGLLIKPTSTEAQLRADVYASGLNQPVAFVQDPSNANVQYVVEKGGRIRVIITGSVQQFDLLDLSTQVSTGSEQGLLGLAFPPDFATSGRFYVNFTDIAGNTVIARFRRSAGNLIADPASRFDLRWPDGQRFVVQPYSNHNGGNLAFGPDGYLYIGLGDGGSGNDPQHRAQSPGTLLGKMLRIDVNVADSDPEGYNVPPDNPFVGIAGVLPEIWSFGLRNPWRYTFDEPRLGGTGALIMGDVGQSTREEIDYEPAARGGRNYGWRNREGTVNNVTSLPPAYLPLTDPIFDYGRDSGGTVVGGFVYRGTALGASYRGRYFFADFLAGRVWSLALGINPGTGEAVALSLTEHTAELSAITPLGAISSFGVDAQGELYLTSFNGTVLKIRLPQPGPIMHLDLAPNRVVTQPFDLSGYAFDSNAVTGTGATTVHVWAFPSSGAPPIFVGVPTYGVDRSDVASVYGEQFRNSGFSIAVSGLPPDSYRLHAFGWLTAIGNFGVVQIVDVTVASGTLLTIDIPASSTTVTQPFHLAGWSIDPGDTIGTGVDTIHVWAYPIAPAGNPIFVGVPLLGGSRPDVAAYYGSPRFQPSGYNMLVSGLAPGTYYIVVYAHSAVTNSFAAAQYVVINVR